MKNVWNFAILIILITIAACDDENPSVSSDCEFDRTNGVYNAYLNDAEQLVLRRILDEQLPEKDDIELPQADVDRVLEALAAVYNAADNLEAADDVVDIYSIHTFPSRSLNGLILGIDSTYAWTQEWMAGNTLTGNPDIDNLINTYNISLANVGIFGNWAVLQSANSLNTVALSNAFAMIDGVNFAQPDGFAGDGNDIEMLEYGAEIRLQYSRGWGDCPSGCISRHYWEFRIDEDCEVEFLGSSGDPL